MGGAVGGGIIVCGTLGGAAGGGRIPVPCSSSVPVSLVSLMECPCAPLEVELDHSPWLSHDLLVPAQVERLSSASSPAEDSLPRIVGPSGLSKPVLALT